MVVASGHGGKGSRLRRGCLASSLLGVDVSDLDPYSRVMAKTPTPEEAIERARRAQDERIESVRLLAVARQKVDDVREATARERAELEARIAERVAEAEREDVKAYSAATAAGWSADELRRIGFVEPEKRARARRRSTRRTSTRGAGQDGPSVPTSEAGDDGTASTSERGEDAAQVHPAAV